ncbi:unnamed protein product, partial [Cladocopium goreaui]
EEHSEAKYDCMAGYSNWRSGWSLDKKSWPGSLARVLRQGAARLCLSGRTAHLQGGVRLHGE